MTIKVKLLTPLVTLDQSYAAGDEYPCSAETAQALIDDQLAIPVADGNQTIEPVDNKETASKKTSPDKAKAGKKKDASDND